MMAPPETKTETCDFRLARVCQERWGTTDAKKGFLTMIGDQPRFACDECAEVITDKVEKTLKVRIIQRGDRVA